MLPFTRTFAATAATALVAMAASSAQAAPIAVTDGTAHWQQARSYGGGQTTWLGYVLSTSGNPMAAANGVVTAGGGAYIRKPDTGAFVGAVTYTDTPAASPTTPWDTGFNVTGGSVDAAAGKADVTATGSIHFTAHAGAMDIKIDSPRIVLNGDGTGGVYSTGATKDRATGDVTTIDASQPLFTLDASAASIVQLEGGIVAISNLAPTMGAVEYFGSSYKAGVAGPNRDPNIFGSFGLVVDTNPLPVVQTIIEKPVEKIVTVEKKVEVDKTSVRRAETLSRRPFSRGTVEVEIREAGSKTVIGEGYVTSKRLRVWVEKGTKLEGKYTLDRTSGSKRLKDKAFVTLGESKKSKKQSAKR